MLVVQSSHFQIRQNILLLADNADACICVESNVSEQNICGGIVFWTAESTERISRSGDRLAFAGLM